MPFALQDSRFSSLRLRDDCYVLPGLFLPLISGLRVAGRIFVGQSQKMRSQRSNPLASRTAHWRVLNRDGVGASPLVVLHGGAGRAKWNHRREGEARHRLLLSGKGWRHGQCRPPDLWEASSFLLRRAALSASQAHLPCSRTHCQVRCP